MSRGPSIKLLIGLSLTLLSCQAAAITTVAGIDFVDVATNLTDSVGAFYNNTTDIFPNPPSTTTGPIPIVDGNGASWVMSGDTLATLDASFAGAFNVANVDVTLLFVGNSYPHMGTITLSGGTSAFSTLFSLDPGLDNLNGYTGFNSVSAAASAAAAPETFAIYALAIPLTGSGTFSGIQLDISGFSAVPSLVGVTAVPVPAAVWLFGSGLIVLAGAARRRK